MRCNRTVINSFSYHYVQTLFILILFVFSQVTLTLSLTSGRRHTWEKPGCTKVAFSRDVEIPNCVRFSITTNACRGFCVSYAYPSPGYTLDLHPNLLITSRAECCNIASTHDVTVRVLCRSGFRSITFKSAVDCVCSICRHG